MNSERKAFEEWAYSNQWNINRFRDMGVDKYVDDFVDAAWHGWKASTQRQGYKLVPLNPTEEMINKVDGVFEVPSWDSNIAIDSDCCINIYKAMIGAVDEK